MLKVAIDFLLVQLPLTYSSFVCVWISKGSLESLSVFQCDLPLVFFFTEYLLVKSCALDHKRINVKLSTLLGSENRSGHCPNDHLRSLHAIFPPIWSKVILLKIQWCVGLRKAPSRCTIVPVLPQSSYFAVTCFYLGELNSVCLSVGPSIHPSTHQ